MFPEHAGLVSAARRRREQGKRPARLNSEVDNNETISGSRSEWLKSSPGRPE
jgi:hypothetical protein